MRDTRRRRACAVLAVGAWLATGDASAVTYDEMVEAALHDAERGSHAAALDMLNKARARAPERAPAYMALGMVLFMTNRPTDAGIQFETALRRASGEDERRSYVTAMEKTTTVFRSGREAELFEKAFAFVEKKRPEAAVPALIEAIGLNAVNPRLRYELGYALVELGRFKEAIPHFERARAVNPGSTPVLKELQHCYEKENRAREALEIVRWRLVLAGNDPQLHLMHGQALARTGQLDEALRVLAAATRRFPRFAPLHYCIGQLIRDHRRDRPAARRAFADFLRVVEGNMGSAGEWGIARPELEDLVRRAKAYLGERGAGSAQSGAKQ